ncbi:hypothetical protein RSAG8_11828, partial [Rhizoctonia solani AG-8 WAC10335]
MGVTSTEFDASPKLQLDMTLNVRKPLLPTEITQYIASYCGYREQRDLAYTCRWFFDSVTPVIWKEVHGVDIIMKLIPGVQVTISYRAEEGEFDVLKYIILDESLLAEDWSRYWYYAPFVQRITPFSSLYDGMDATLHVQGWRFLFMKLEGSILLPNLRNLDTNGIFHSSYFDRLAWFVLLLSPSLQGSTLEDISLGLDSNLPPTRPLSLLLGAISKSSLGNSSRISVARDEWHPSEQMLASLFPSKYPEGSFWFSNVSTPTGLRDLKITLLSPSTLWDELCTIGSLPLLEGLEVVFPMHSFSSEDKYNLKETPLPSSLFPSLRRLNLKGASNVNLFRWVWGLKPMVSGLSSAHINTPNFESNRQSLAVNFAQPIRNNSPNLSDLSINMHTSSDGMGVLEVTCELLSVVPLKVLKFDWFTGNLGSFPTAHSGSTFPHLRRLDISPAFHLPDWASLPKIAKAFPNLEYLRIKSSTQSESYKPLDVDCIDHMAFQSIELQISVSCTERGPARDEEKWGNIQHDITVYMTNIWPNASVAIDSSHPYYIVHPPDTTFHPSNTTVQDDFAHFPANIDVRISRDESANMYGDVFLFLSCVLAWFFGVFRY